MNYEPNFNDPRVQRTIKKSLNYVALYLKSNKTCWISRNEIYRHFGNTSRPLGRWLKDQLLIVADDYFNMNTGICKKYCRNEVNFQQLYRQLGMKDSLLTLSPELEQQLETGDFEYTEKSNRSHNTLQYVPKQVRGRVLANRGYQYHYDIEAAAPTLLIQRAHRLDPNLDLKHLEYYVNNRSQIRSVVALECNIKETQVKTLINALLQGAYITSWQGSKVFQELDYNYNSVINLKHNPTVQDIQQDIRHMWQVLKKEFPKEMITTLRGQVRAKRLSARDKSGLYRQLEAEVGEVIRRLLKKRKIKCLWIHDGWCSNGFIDPLDVEQEVRRTTGYSIKLEWNKYEDT